MSKLTRAKTDLIFLKKYLENMKEHEWRYADYEIKAYERLLMYCETYITLKELKNKMTKEEFEKIRQISKEDFEKWKKEEFENMRQLSKEEYEKWNSKQIKLEMQSPQYIDAKIPEEIKDTDGFLNLIREKLKDYNDRVIGYSQECEGTFKIKDGKVTDIDIKGIAFIPRFRDKDEEVE